MNISDIIREIVNNDQDELVSLDCIVDKVTGNLVDCTPINSKAQLLDIRLQTEDSSGVIFVPKVGSVVTATMTSNVTGYISMFSQLDSIKFLDGSFGGLIKISDLVSRLNDYESAFNQLKTDFTSWVPVPNDGGAALKTLLSSGFLTVVIPNTVDADFENDLITHGTV